jgi:hypothetical protein
MVHNVLRYTMSDFLLHVFDMTVATGVASVMWVGPCIQHVLIAFTVIAQQIQPALRPSVST